MPRLTEEGQKVVADIAGRHAISADGVLHMLMAVLAGQGTQAQFNHSDFGGMGQWSLGGMTMVGDMFNNQLKAKVDNLCVELSTLVREQALFAAPPASQSQSQSQGSGYGATGASLFLQSSDDWPIELGQPASVGAQNDMRYAYFPNTRRLAIKVAGRTTVYDTGTHQITGFGQAQSRGQSLSFTSQHGLVQLEDLPIVDDSPKKPKPKVETTDAPHPEKPAAIPDPVVDARVDVPDRESMTDDQIFSRIERLAGLFEKGILNAAEYEAKKAELLARL